VNFSGKTAATIRSERNCFSFSFLLILDEGGFRGGRVDSAYSSLATTACPRPAKVQTAGNSAVKGRHSRKKRRGIGGGKVSVLDRNGIVLVFAFCSFLMKVDLGEAG
jgi:hypothetical protein